MKLASNPIEALNMAVDELEKHGWKQGVMGTKRGKKCMMGALFYVCSGEMIHPINREQNNIYNDARTALEDVMPMTTLFGLRVRMGIVQFNDRQFTQKETVIKKLQEAAKRLKKSKSSAD